MKKVGILGGIACGKSTITKHLHELGACVLEGDKIGHRVLELPEIVDQMEARWRPMFPHWMPIFDNTGHVVRSTVAKIVFNYRDELRFLETIMWPILNKELEASIARYHPDYTKVLILDIPLLVEAGWLNRCDEIIFVHCPEERRLERFCERQRDYSHGECVVQHKAREERQIPLGQKLESAQMVMRAKNSKVFEIDNSGDINNLKQQVKDTWALLQT